MMDYWYVVELFNRAVISVLTWERIEGLQFVLLTTVSILFKVHSNYSWPMFARLKCFTFLCFFLATPTVHFVGRN